MRKCVKNFKDNENIVQDEYDGKVKVFPWSANKTS